MKSLRKVRCAMISSANINGIAIITIILIKQDIKPVVLFNVLKLITAILSCSIDIIMVIHLLILIRFFIKRREEVSQTSRSAKCV